MMRILFVSSGNTKFGISPIVKNQGESLKKLGVEVAFFTIKGKGFLGYFRNIFSLRKFLKEKGFDAIHAHYSLSAMVASLAGARPLIVSLMGSDVKASPILAYIIQVFHRLFWKKVIVKSQDMKNSCRIENAIILPNGVDMEKFKPIPKEKALQKMGWDIEKKHVLFAANPNRPEKNYQLARRAFEEVNDTGLQLHYLADVPNDDMPYYYNASEIILLTSLWEGSPNVIKEAMACNCKIVATEVGDVREVIANTVGCYITGFEVTEVSESIKKALQLPSKTSGREQIGHLDETIIAHQLKDIYKKTVL